MAEEEQQVAMDRDLNALDTVRHLLRCPVCGGELHEVQSDADAELACTTPGCAKRFPIIAGIPILINDANSVFSIRDFVDQPPRKLTSLARLQGAAIRRLPSIGRHPKAAHNYKALGRLLLADHPAPRVLVVGGSIVGEGMSALLPMDGIELVETDVVFGPRTQIVCDAHDLPFGDRSFDGVIVQAVLEHVADPYRCVEEIHRVLKEDGLVYAETPFMQQVHLGRYDFTRFTHLGHRRLFRKFAELESGAVAGPGTVLAWSYEHLLLSFVRRKPTRRFVKAFARLTGFWLKYLDMLVEGRPGALDASSGHYFLGRKSERILSDRELVGLYRGAQ